MPVETINSPIFITKIKVLFDTSKLGTLTTFKFSPLGILHLLLKNRAHEVDAKVTQKSIYLNAFLRLIRQNISFHHYPTHLLSDENTMFWNLTSFFEFAA